MSKSELLHLWERYKDKTLTDEEWAIWGQKLSDLERNEDLIEYWVQGMVVFEQQKALVVGDQNDAKSELNETEELHGVSAAKLAEKAVGVDRSGYYEARNATQYANNNVVKYDAENIGENSVMETDIKVNQSKWGIAHKLWWAAAIVLLLVTGIYIFVKNDKRDVPNVVATEEKLDALPGKEGAVLTLADGRKLVLDSITQQELTLIQADASLLLNEGTLAYKVGETAGEMVYNTLTTPNGRQFKIVLPDGTVVWLNAASSIQYPVAFSKAIRKVRITGEAYFEVQKDKTRPFIVEINNLAEIEVVGTSFNVNSYTTEAVIKASLITGSINIKGLSASGNSTKTIIAPGQQAEMSIDYSLDAKNNNAKVLLPIIVKDRVNMEQVLAWRNGFFQFDNLSLKEVMNQLARWYDIEVVYEGKVPEISFFGKMSRNISLGGLLRSLKASELNFRIEEGGKRLVVL